MTIYVFKTSIAKLPQKVYNKIATSIDEIAEDHFSTSSKAKYEKILAVMVEHKVKFEQFNEEQ